jgi:hypothetical protein
VVVFVRSYQVLDGAVGQRRFEEAGRDGVDGDTVLGPLDSQRFGHGNQRSLGRGIARCRRHMGCLRDASENRCNVDDAAYTTHSHQRVPNANVCDCIALCACK